MKMLKCGKWKVAGLLPRGSHSHGDTFNRDLGQFRPVGEKRIILGQLDDMHLRLVIERGGITVLGGPRETKKGFAYPLSGGH